jgi:hypothetical protein
MGKILLNKAGIGALEGQSAGKRFGQLPATPLRRTYPTLRKKFNLYNFFLSVKRSSSFHHFSHTSKQHILLINFLFSGIERFEGSSAIPSESLLSYSCGLLRIFR